MEVTHEPGKLIIGDPKLTRKIRTYSVEECGRVEPLTPRSLIFGVIQNLKGSRPMSRSVRFKMGSALEAMMDRLIELQRLYDQQVSELEEFDLEKNPHRTDGKGLLIRIELATMEELAFSMKTIIERKPPYPLTELLSKALPTQIVTELLYPRADLVSGSTACILSFVLRIEGNHESLSPTTDHEGSASESPIQD